MNLPVLNEQEIEFLLYDFLDTENLLQRPRYHEHSKETFNATLETARQIAEKYFANHNAKGDSQEPTFDGETVTIIAETKQAWDAFAEAGFLAAHYEFEKGGMQLPEVILRAAMAYFNAANVATSGYPFLTIGAANLINEFASDAQKETYLPYMQSGQFAGTMALTEPNQGSALADIKTKALPQADGSYRLFGTKMYISGGDQNLTENIIHMVLARIEGAPAGTKGISLFICPKYLVGENGQLGARNDVKLAGLLHKMGYRNTTSTVLNFGEEQGAHAFLVGEANKGLFYMFQMMNEARIGVALGASCLGYQGFQYSLEYAKGRPQGRHPSNKDPESPQVNIIKHADVKRMLLAQKAYSEGALALCLYASSLMEDSKTAESDEQRQQAFKILDLITPMVKSWPSKYALRANELAIQVLGGSGYIREYPVEQMYRDNRLNPIHEGTEGIQGLDLLGRKVPMGNLENYQLLISKILETSSQFANDSELSDGSTKLVNAVNRLNQVTSHLMAALAKGKVDSGLANATLYLDIFGHTLVAWIWLRQMAVANEKLKAREALSADQIHYYLGKLQAGKFFIRYELPQIYANCDLLESLDSTCLEMQEDWF
ncbi:acyl-CoA dehydrogenase [Aliikangiella marina]|uniref:Acyl-CoA dehydrogenase n=1 Tax=Aliikangiella marina TaxID=1712262 RepID=A0A545T7J5_9GAMM|nr:acyl-CoA dehydrogenase [Aliikangiella marina]TQV73135.1 acyl-CoA dehydrogenase [Aliikangiella marina]